jgi:hypothetical protein
MSITDNQFVELANKIKLGKMTLIELSVTRQNQVNLLNLGHTSAQMVIDAIDHITSSKDDGKGE